MAVPQDITRSPNLAVTLLSWAESGAELEPSAGRKATGLLAADLVTKEEFNWLWLEPYRWLRALFSRYLSSGEALVGSWFVDKGTGIWSDDAVGPLEGFLSDGPAGTASLVTDLWLDPDGTGGVRVQVSVAKAAPATFLANRDTYVFAPIDLIVPPMVSEPELTFLDVAVGLPAPATPLGTVLVWRVETDGAGIVDQEIFLPDFPVLKHVGFEEISAAIAMVQGDLDVGGELEVLGLSTLADVEITGTLDVTGNSTLGVDETNVQQVHGDVTVGTDFTSTTTLEGDVTIGSASSNTPSIKGDLTIGSTNLSVHTVDGVMTFNDGATCNGLLSALAGINIAGTTISGTAGSTVDVEVVEQQTSKFDDSGVSLAPNIREARWNDTHKLVRMPDGGGGTIRSEPVPAHGPQASFTTAAVIATTGAGATFRAAETEPLLIMVTFGYQHTVLASGILNTRIEIAGPVTVDVFIEAWRLDGGTGWLPFHQVYKWTPTDSFVLPGTRNYVAALRVGSSLGANLQTRNLNVTVIPIVEV